MKIYKENPDKKKINRIAVFQYEWDVRSYTLDILTMLVEKGYYIDLFLTSCDNHLVDLENIKKNSNIKIYDLTPRNHNKVLNFISKNFWRVVSKLDQILVLRGMLFRILKKDISCFVIKQSSRIISQNHSTYKCFIGIEKKGLIWVGILNKKYKFNIPFLYYSLELYIEDHPIRYTNPFFPRIRKLEKKYHKKAVATIIQDNMRANVLFSSNNIERQPIIFVPISLRGDIIPNRARYFHNKFNIPEEIRIILYFGMIKSKSRLSKEIAEQAKNLNNNNRLVFHGYGAPKEIEDLTGLTSDKICISTELVPYDKIFDLISSSDIGLVLYSTDNSNNRLTAFSSEKIALFSKAGIPIIAFDNENYRKLINTLRCGELINTLDELPNAVQKIFLNYELYRENAFQAYKQFYWFDRHFKNIIKFIENEL